MGGSKERRHQKKLEQTRKKREAKRQRARAISLIPKGAQVVELARRGAFGPTWISDDYDESDSPALVTIAVTRRAPRGLLLTQIVLVDRTCLGIKNAFTPPPCGELEVESHMRSLANGGIVLERCEPLVAQSVVFHAIDYARALGFEPHRDFIGAFLGPRPDELLETPWAHRARPWYVPGSTEDSRTTVARLRAKLGPDGFDFVMPFENAAGADALWENDELWDDDDDDDDDDDGAILEDSAV